MQRVRCSIDSCTGCEFARARSSIAPPGRADAGLRYGRGMAIDLRGKTALVTGASSGIGAAFARQLAAAGANLVIAARRAAELEALATTLRACHGVTVEVIAIDLGQPGAGAALFARTEGAGRAIDVLINNAGFGEHRHFVDQDWARVAQQLQLNVVTLTELTHQFARAMAGRGRGHILNVASIGAYTPSPTYATYSAGTASVRPISCLPSTTARSMTFCNSRTLPGQR